MPTPLGAHNPRIALARELLTQKGRRAQSAFSFEGPTLVAEAAKTGMDIQALFATREAYERVPAAMELESRGVEVFLVDDRTLRKLSDVETPSGLVAVASMRLKPAVELLERPGLILALAGIADPGNAGTLVRTAEAFGVSRVIFGSRGAEPHHPKVIRAAMGALFRARIARAAPSDLQTALAGWEVTGLSASGEPLHLLSWPERSVLVVGNERHGLEGWRKLCSRLAGIPMPGQAESLNAAVAGSIALYEASKQLA